MKTLLLLLMTSLVSMPSFAGDSEELAKEKKASAAYMARMLEEPHAVTIGEGVVIRPIYVNLTDQFAHSTDTVQVAYHLVDREGKVIDESLTADALAIFPLSKLIKCWQIAIPRIAFGSLYKVSCPSDTAYGDKGAGDGLIKPGAALTFRITMFGIEK